MSFTDIKGLVYSPKMAQETDQSGPSGNAGKKVGGNTNKAGGNTGISGGGRPTTILLNPERVPLLLPKWQKLLGTDIERISVDYRADGVTVELYGMPGSAYAKLDQDGNPDPITIADYNRKKAEVNKPGKEEAIFAFKNKFEVRLNQEFPKSLDLGDGSEESLRRAVEALPFHQRRIMLMSNKAFKTAYPNGVAPGGNPGA